MYKLIKKVLIHPIKRRVAKYYLVLLRNYFGLKVIGITGSAGKTTTKDMLGSILKQTGNTVVSYANIDPVYNIPTTILKCRPSTKFLVLEMGIEFPGEMDFYIWLANPDVGILTSIYQTHTQFFGSIDGVAKEKGKLIKNLSNNSIAVLNEDDNRVKDMAKKTRAKVAFYSLPKKVVYTQDFKSKFEINFGGKKAQIFLPMLGKQFVANSMSAATSAYQLGVGLEKIKKGLEGFSPPPQRMVIKKISKNSLLVDDSYNANPSAVKATLEVFADVKPKSTKIFIFGEMKELGSVEKEAHAEVGKLAAKLGVDYIIGIGDLVRQTLESAKKAGIKPANLFLVKSNDEILGILKNIRKSNVSILVKGSRSMKLEEVVAKIK